MIMAESDYTTPSMVSTNLGDVGSSSSKGKATKRSSNSYSVEEWKRHRPLITRLYFEEGRTLKEVREYLEREFNFAPTERMYKSRLHSWGLDKKKKEHEMLDLVRQGLQQKGEDKDKVFMVRGRQVTLADALHYFNRKGIKDPSTLLESNVTFAESSMEVSSPEDAEARTPLSSRGDHHETGNSLDSDYDTSQSPSVFGGRQLPASAYNTNSHDFPEGQLALLKQHFQISHWQDLPKFNQRSIDGSTTPRDFSPAEKQYIDYVTMQTTLYYQQLFAARDLSVTNGRWSPTSDRSLADQFYYCMYHGYGYLWSSQPNEAQEEFSRAYSMIERLIRDQDVGFLVYIFDLIIRHDATGYQEPLQALMKHVAETASTIYGNTHPLFTISECLLSPLEGICKSKVAEEVLRRLLGFFSDSIGYFHPETIALLQTFASSLLNGKQYHEAAARFHQLVDAFETTTNKTSYESCYALRSMSEAFFYGNMLRESVQALKTALDRSVQLPREEEREIHARCFRAIAEIWNKVGRREEALSCMQYVVNCCIETFGSEHTFVSRARAHQKSLRDGESASVSAIPPMVYRLGRGGPAAKMIWTSRTSPLRLQA